MRGWMRGLLRGIRFEARRGDPLARIVEAEQERTIDAISGALTYAMKVRDVSSRVTDHSARVSILANQIGKRLGVSEADQHVLTLSAHLHEIGIFTLPPELLERATPLSTAELEQVRAQAGVSAEVARLVHRPRVARLIENQYLDYGTLESKHALDESDLLLAGILRVADVLVAVSYPRPYQPPMPRGISEALLERGAGIWYHPQAVIGALTIPKFL